MDDICKEFIDHVVQGHDGYGELQKKAKSSGQHLYTYLNDRLDQLQASRPRDFLTGDLHVWPDFHGNRSPLADLTLKGMTNKLQISSSSLENHPISHLHKECSSNTPNSHFFLAVMKTGSQCTDLLVVGLTLSKGLDDLALLYLATVQSIALGTRHILDTMKSSGHNISSLFLCGGLSKNPLFVQMHADITGLPVILSKEVESVLVGAAILGACASRDFTSIMLLALANRERYPIMTSMDKVRPKGTVKLGDWVNTTYKIIFQKDIDFCHSAIHWTMLE
ncbi:unnamed protein product [Ranitomeya imitator]|uniref:Carbohydrate kinase FGGY C-terminal domain-containing protein n=1 Tax=Ranitomeya imitator TaxID=111125 RepID=A0ABN9LDR1_9NEOB|nr:unnamed protein product [Ranitomeya imitator]